MTCKSVTWYKRNERPGPGPHQVECGTCGGDGVVGGSCSCGRCGEYPGDCTCKQEKET